MATVKVRVNPNDPEDYVVMLCPDLPYPWNRVSDGYLFQSGDAPIRDWQEFELEIPKPIRVFKAGDMYQRVLTGDIYVRTKTAWVNRGQLTSPSMDYEIWDNPKCYAYIGNINDE